MLRSIRSRLIGLVLATVVPFLALIGAGLWDQWRGDQASAIARSVDEARLLAAQVDDHLGNVENLLIGLTRAVSWDAADIAANDALLARLRNCPILSAVSGCLPLTAPISGLHRSRPRAGPMPGPAPIFRRPWLASSLRSAR